MAVSLRSSLILIVENEWAMRRMVAAEFQSAGWQVLQAARGEDAVGHIQSPGRGIEAVFTSVELAGGVDGWDVADVFRALHPDLPVIYASASSAQIARQVADSRFFRKPYRASDILRACMRFGRLGYGGADRGRLH